jgi:hypothetical protein
MPSSKIEVTARSREGPQISASSEVRDAADALNGVEYWSRVWVFQEVILAINLVPMLGTNVLGWKRLGKLCCNANTASQHRKAVSFFVARDLHGDGIGPTYELSLVAALNAWSGNECSNPRDHVFGLMGLVKKRQRVVVDYDLSVREVFCATLAVVYKYQRSMPKIEMLDFGHRLSTAMELGPNELNLDQLLDDMFAKKSVAIHP